VEEGAKHCERDEMFKILSDMGATIPRTNHTRQRHERLIVEISARDAAELGRICRPM